jgi:lipopolysaccharide transport system ATP-binding protein
MSDAIIRVENLGKKYRIQHQAGRPRYVALRDVIAQKLKAPFQFLRRSKMADGSSGQSPISQLPTPRASKTEDFWALKGVSFEVRQGEVVGIIGRNGAGKSTLLKILSRITDPTEGRVRIKGRVASLLEVGTGFHPELTGRENIFLNGAILGMHRSEIKQKFDEIVAFAEVEKFLDTPVKRYSSGMYVRLAFAVAAHLEPEILIVDEVLAVGDAQFQKKCLGKMQDVAKGGRTVLFVSHNMAAVERLCSRGFVLEGGRVAFGGGVGDSIRFYLQRLAGRASTLPDPDTRPGNGHARIRDIDCPPFFESGDCLEITFDIAVRQPVRNPDFRMGLYSLGGSCICAFANSLLKEELGPLGSNAKVTLRTDPLPLNFGSYTINVSISEGTVSPVIVDRIENAASFQVVSGDPFGSGKLPPAGHLALKHSWRMECI